MKVQVEDTGACRKVLHVEVPADVVADEYKRVTKYFASAVRVPGFRKGKAPAAVVEKQHKEGIIEETRDRLLPKYYQEALKNESIEPLTVIGVSDVDMDPSAPMKFDVTVDVRPEFTLPDYEKISLKSESVDVDDADIDAAIDDIRERGARFEDIDPRPIKVGDLVQIDYEANDSSGILAEMGEQYAGFQTGKDFWYATGEQEFLPGISKGLEGAELKTEKTISVNFPEEYQIPEVAGKSLEYSISIKGLREKVLPELNEEFLKPFQVESEDELRSKIKEDMAATKEQQEGQRLKNEIVNNLLEKTEMELPESAVEQETRQSIQRIVQEQMRHGVPSEKLEGEHDAIYEAAKAQSSGRIKAGFILGEIAQKENIEVGAKEVSEQIRQDAARYRMSPDKYRSELEEHGAMDGFRENLLAEKVLEFLLEKAEISK